MSEKHIPEFMEPFLSAPPLVRLKEVGMNCGCEYTRFPRFRTVAPYSRYTHSVNTALIVWEVTGDRIQTLAALFHDIATPAFAHTVDFLHKDHLHQEWTEKATERVIRESAELCRLLAQLGISVDEVKDYSCYPLADNMAPRLCADRLEYTLGNLWRYGFTDKTAVQRYWEDIVVDTAEDGKEELCFRHVDTARQFAADALRCGRVYTSEEDRYAMQILSELLAEAIARGVLEEDDLMRTEPEVIDRLNADDELRQQWQDYRKLSRMVPVDEAPADRRRIVQAKRRYIDPLVVGKGRVTGVDARFRRETELFLQEDQQVWICGAAEETR